MRIFRRETPELDKVREVEGEIREFVRRENSRLRRCPEPDDSDLIANNINSLLQQVAGTSVQQVDRLIAELQGLREKLSTEGARLEREVVKYATLSEAAMQSTKILAETATDPLRPAHPRVSLGYLVGVRKAGQALGLAAINYRCRSIRSPFLDNFVARAGEPVAFQDFQ